MVRAATAQALVATGEQRSQKDGRHQVLVLLRALGAHIRRSFESKPHLGLQFFVGHFPKRAPEDSAWRDMETPTPWGHDKIGATAYANLDET